MCFVSVPCAAESACAPRWMCRSGCDPELHIYTEHGVLGMRTPRGQTELKSLVCKKSSPVVVFKNYRRCGAGTRSWMCLGEPCACGDKV